MLLLAASRLGDALELVLTRLPDLLPPAPLILPQSQSHTRRRQSSASSRPTTFLSHHQYHQHQSNHRRRSPHKTLFTSSPTAAGLSSWCPNRKNPRKCSPVVASSAASAGSADSADDSLNDRSAAGAPGAGTGSDGNLAGSGSPDGDGAEVAVGVKEVGGVAVEDGGTEGEKASALPEWVPRWALEMHPAGQAAASVGLYMFHMVRGPCWNYWYIVAAPSLIR